MTARRGSGEGSIFQRAQDGRWVGTLTVSEPGRPRRRKSVVRATRREVQAALRELQRSVDKGIVPSGDRTTVAAYLDRWLREMRPPKLRPRTHRRYAELLTIHVIPEIGGIELRKLTLQDVKSLLARLGQKNSRYGRPLSAQTVVHARAVLRRALSDAEDVEIVVKNVARGRAVGAPKVERPLIEAMTPDQAYAIVDAVADDPWGPAYRLALWTGLRQGELLGLRWSDVDEEGGWIRVRQTFGRYGGEGHFGPPKTDKSRRDVPITDDGLAALRDQRRRQAEARLAAGPGNWRDLGDNGPLVFTDATGGPLDPGLVSKHIHTLLAPIGLPRLRMHDLRHGYITMLIRQGVPIPIIAKLAGHASPVMTLNVYGHVANDSLQEAAGRLNALPRTGS